MVVHPQPAVLSQGELKKKKNINNNSKTAMLVSHRVSDVTALS